VCQEDHDQDSPVKGSQQQVRRQRDDGGMKNKDSNPAFSLDHPLRLEDEVAKQMRREYCDECFGHCS